MSEQLGPSAPGALTEDARIAIAASHLGSLPRDVLATLAAGASRLGAAAGATFHREGDTGPHLELVVSGLVRIYVTVPDGRTMTIRYCRPGAMIGAVSLFAPRFYLPATIQAVTDAEMLVFRAAAARDTAERDPRLASAMLRELSERVLSFITEIPHGLATVRQRVARHLLDLATERQRGSELVAIVGQEELADAVGTVREVVVRALRELREEGLIHTERRRIVLHDPDRLAAEVLTAASRSDTPGT